MSEVPTELDFQVELLDESSGHCDCCGNDSKCIWGLVHLGEATVAAYWMHWTEGHLSDTGANLDLVIGKWGEGASADDRSVVAIRHLEQSDGGSSLMVIDAAERQISEAKLASTALRRDEVIGTPLAAQVFAIADAIYLQDGRLFDYR